MTVTSQQYAALTHDAYEDKYPVGVSAPGQEPRFEYEGVTFKVLEHVNNRKTGYQGTVYQNEETGDIVVAHRGTEFRKLRSDTMETIRDLALTDGGMLLARTNMQSDDAIALTGRAMNYAEDIGQERGKVPQVTNTGHSLGGTLAQITSHKFGLGGETFNAYGAVSLRGHGVPEGGDRMINHVKAVDFVSAASPHYGQVHVYADAQDIDKLNRHGYHANPLKDRLAVDMPVVVAAKSLGDHDMHYFMPVDAQGRRDTSFLADAGARTLAADNAAIIADYRGDVALIRSTTTNTIGLPVQGIHRGMERLQDNMEESLRERFNPPPQGIPQVLPGQIPPGFPVQGYRPLGAVDHDGSQRRTDILQADPAAFVDRLLAAARGGDDIAFRQMTREAASSPAGLELRAQAVATVDRHEELARQQQLAEQQQMLTQQQDAPVRAMRMG